MGSKVILLRMSAFRAFTLISVSHLYGVNKCSAATLWEESGWCGTGELSKGDEEAAYLSAGAHLHLQTHTCVHQIKKNAVSIISVLP